MSLRKALLAALASCALAGTALADPMRTMFTKENKFPGAMGWEVSVGGGGSSFDDEDVDSYYGDVGVRFGLTDRLALSAAVPYVGYSAEDVDENGIGDMVVGAEFLFFEDIFEYAWVIPYAMASLPTGDDDKGLGAGKGRGHFGLSVGTTTMDVLHWIADLNVTTDGSMAEEDEDVVAGSLGLIWDLDEQASVLGEVQFRDDPINDKHDYGMMYHLGLVYRVNERFSVMAYGGSSSHMDIDFYGMGKVVCQF